MQQINISELKAHTRNNEFFDDITGDSWKAFLESIESSGIIEPIVVTQNMVIVSGHQRVRAAKELGIETIMVDIRKYDDEGDNLPNYVKILRKIIYNKELGDKRVIIFFYLCSRRALDDTVAFSISELCHWSHLKPNYHDGKINHKYLEVLELLSHHGYFESFPDFEKLAQEKKNSTDYYNVKISTEKFDMQMETLLLRNLL